MDWADILIKIGVGACLGFGIITLAKLAVKKNQQERKTSADGSALNSIGTKRDEK